MPRRWALADLIVNSSGPFALVATLAFDCHVQPKSNLKGYYSEDRQGLAMRAGALATKAGSRPAAPVLAARRDPHYSGKTWTSAKQTKHTCSLNTPRVSPRPRIGFRQR